jgi:hypothetical protein
MTDQCDRYTANLEAALCGARGVLAAALVAEFEAPNE